MSSRLKVRESAWTSGWCWFTCTPAQWHNARTFRVSISVAPWQGHHAAINSPSSKNAVPLTQAPKQAGMARDASTRILPGLGEAFGSGPPQAGLSHQAGVLTSQVVVSEGQRIPLYWTRFTCLPSLYCAYSQALRARSILIFSPPPFFKTRSSGVRLQIRN